MRHIIFLLLFFLILGWVNLALSQDTYPEQAADGPVFLQEVPEVDIPEELPPEDQPQPPPETKEGYGPTWFEDAWLWYLEQGQQQD